MGGAGLYAPPVKSWDGVATWSDHTNRSTPSTEPGVDWYCPIGTELHAAASGVIVEINTWNVGPATGLFITIDLDDGRRVRYLHLSAIFVEVGWRVPFDAIIGLTGATGYGTWDWSGDPSTGGSHVHETIFPNHRYVFGRYATLDPWPLTDTERPAPPVDYAPLRRRQKEDAMYVRGTTNPDVYATSTDANGNLRTRLCPKGEAAYAGAGGLVITGDDATLTMLGIEGQYTKPYSPTVDATVEFTPEQLREIASQIKPGMTPAEVKAAVAAGMASVVGSVGFTPKP